MLSNDLSFFEANRPIHPNSMITDEYGIYHAIKTTVTALSPIAL